MPACGLQTLMATALTDATVCRALLAGDPAVFAGFDLTMDEVAHLQSISATTLEEFARQAHAFFYGEDPQDEEAVHHSRPHSCHSIASALTPGGIRC